MGRPASAIRCQRTSTPCTCQWQVLAGFHGSPGKCGADPRSANSRSSAGVGAEYGVPPDRGSTTSIPWSPSSRLTGAFRGSR